MNRSDIDKLDADLAKIGILDLVEKNMKKSFISWPNTIKGNSINDNNGISLDYEYKFKKKELDEQKKHIKTVETHNVGDLISKGVPEFKWIVQDMIPKQGFVILGGAPGSGKSFFSMHVTNSIVSGKPVGNYFDVIESGNVLYIDEENGFVTILNRFQKLAKGQHIDVGTMNNIKLVVFESVQIDTFDGYTKLIALIEKYEPKIIVLDSLVRMMAGNENDATDVRMIFDNIRKILKEHEVCFIALHHTSKTANGKDQYGLRGSGDFSAAADVVITFTNKKDFFKVEVVKNRHVELSKFDDMCFELETIYDEEQEEMLTMTYNVKHDTYLSAVDKATIDLKEWLDVSQVINFKTRQAVDYLKRLGHTRNAVFDGLKRCCDKGVVTKDGRGRWINNLTKSQLSNDIKLTLNEE